MKEFNGIIKMSDDLYNKKEAEKKRTGHTPDWWGGISTVSFNAIKQADELIYKSKDLIHEFFNHKSDANKYLSASQQEDLEKYFSEFVEKFYYKH